MKDNFENVALASHFMWILNVTVPIVVVCLKTASFKNIEYEVKCEWDDRWVFHDIARCSVLDFWTVLTLTFNQTTDLSSCSSTWFIVLRTGPNLLLLLIFNFSSNPGFYFILIPNNGFQVKNTTSQCTFNIEIMDIGLGVKEACKH